MLGAPLPDDGSSILKEKLKVACLFEFNNIFVTFITNVVQQVHVLLFEGRPAVLVAESNGNHNVSRGSRLFIIRVCENFLRNTHGFIMPSADNPPVTSLCPAHHRQVLHPERQRLVGVDPNAAPIRFGIDGTDYDPPRAIVLMIAQQTRDFHGIANGYGNAVHAVVVVDGYFAVRIGRSISIKYCPCPCALALLEGVSSRRVIEGGSYCCRQLLRGLDLRGNASFNFPLKYPCPHCDLWPRRLYRSARGGSDTYISKYLNLIICTYLSHGELHTCGMYFILFISL